MMDDRPFAGRVALITGGAGAGMGSAIAHRLARQGAAIIVVDQHAARTTARVEELAAADRPGRPRRRAVGGSGAPTEWPSPGLPSKSPTALPSNGCCNRLRSSER